MPLFITAIVLALSAIPCCLSIWPIPRSLDSGNQILKLSGSFDISINFTNPPQDLLDAVTRTKYSIQTDQLGRLTVGRGSSDSTAFGSAKTLRTLMLALEQSASTAQPIATEAVVALDARDEGYSLSVPLDGSAGVVSANTTLGLLRGLSTFEQLWYTYDGTIYTNYAPLTIVNDSPAYAYRGFMLDTARNFFSVSDIKRTLDAMYLVKINTFHWHITDSQSWPIQVVQFPELAQAGAYSTNQSYTPNDIQDVVTYAGERGIDVLVEIDTPGHTAIIGASHPEYVACYLSDWITFAGEPPAGQLRLADASVANFTAAVLAAVAETLPSTMFSTGGDELDTACYAADGPTQMMLNESGRTLFEALDIFTSTTHGALHALGKTAVVWEEMVLEYNTTTLRNDTIVMVWISSDDAAAVVQKGYRIVHAPSNYFYLDCGAGEWIGNDPTGNSWCDPFKTWQESYTFNPLANISSAQVSLVLGGEQLLWTEQSGPENLDSIVWPRAASSAEIFWTGDTLPDGFDRVGNISEALPRLHDVRYRMVQRGIKAIRLQPEWCALRPQVCDG
ncbi:glycoside hydrolase family 20 protein [Lentinula edodes]|uniref:glycoside hydrolase family 20 protein n=1 Tax=Lentinula edodes TaxID=5353 RepID=UPI001E8D9252|nr:glycoside hydrolase family 20 protein [Lentinula edodes]KAH7872348.1 glycoside hydrolase family 20 protein [Lentinula edodes]